MAGHLKQEITLRIYTELMEGKEEKLWKAEGKQVLPQNNSTNDILWQK